jgi:hypothetical protein
VLEGVVVIAGDVVGIAAAEALALGVMLLLAESIDGLLQLCLRCSLLLDLLLHDLGSLHYRPSSVHVLLHEPKVFILLMKVCQLIFNNGFDFILRVLVLIFLGFGFFVWVLIVLLLLLLQ